jgi:hypothetical protein
MERTEIATQNGQTVKQDAYGHLRNAFPGGMPGRVASVIRRDETDALAVRRDFDVSANKEADNGNTR